MALAFVFGYALTLLPLIGPGMSFGAAAGLAFAADTLSITVMGIVDNWLVAFPVKWLIARGRGHAVVHGKH